MGGDGIATLLDVTLLQLEVQDHQRHEALHLVLGETVDDGHLTPGEQQMRLVPHRREHLCLEVVGAVASLLPTPLREALQDLLVGARHLPAVATLSPGQLELGRFGSLAGRR
jgi:hypothetical protein